MVARVVRGLLNTTGAANARSGKAVLSDDAFAELFNAEWEQHRRRSIDGTIKAGQRLLQRKAAIPKGQWLAFIRSGKLAVKEDTAERLMRIAEYEPLLDSAIWRNVPTSYRTLSELALLPEETFRAWLAKKYIHPTMRFSDAVPAVGVVSRGNKAEDRKPTPDDNAALHQARAAYRKELSKLSTVRKAQEFAELYLLTHTTPAESVEKIFAAASKRDGHDNVAARNRLTEGEQPC